MDVDLCIFCEREVTWVDEALSCNIYAKWQHRLCYTDITDRDIYNAANRDQAEFEFVCSPCQHHDTEFIIEDLPGQFPDIPDEVVSSELVCTISFTGVN